MAAAPLAQLSEPLNAATVTSSTVTLSTQPGGVAVTGTVTYDNTARSITFTPTALLAPNTSYRLELIGGPSGIADLAGNQLATVNTTFTTGSATATTVYVSDMSWGTITNGWGSPERDRSNGEQGSADGGPLRVAGITYPKGVGAHANSVIPLDLTGLNCARFQSVIGVDDEVGNSGSVRFQVWNGTTTMLTQSAVLTGASATATIDVDITGITNLRLVITDNADGNVNDHADWADAKLTCGSGADTTAPTVVTTHTARRGGRSQRGCGAPGPAFRAAERCDSDVFDGHPEHTARRCRGDRHRHLRQHRPLDHLHSHSAAGPKHVLPSRTDRRSLRYR